MPSVIDYWILPHFGGKTFFQITGVSIKEFIPTLVWKAGRKKGQALSASRIRNILIPLRAIWDDANEEHRWELPYTMRHTFAAWALTLRMDPNKLVNLMGHGSKKMIYEVYGNYVEGLETDAGKILKYFGNDFIGLKENTTLPFTANLGESHGESGKMVQDNQLK